jgi:hypothetical protein
VLRLADGGDVAGVHQRPEPLRHLLRGGCLRRLLDCWPLVGFPWEGLALGSHHGPPRRASENGGLHGDGKRTRFSAHGFRLLSPWWASRGWQAHEILSPWV